MGEVSFRFIERTQGTAAAQAAEAAYIRSTDSYEAIFGDYDAVLDARRHETYVPVATAEHKAASAETPEQRVYRIAGRVSVVTVVKNIPMIEHRDYWPDPVLPDEERTYIHPYVWGQGE